MLLKIEELQKNRSIMAHQEGKNKELFSTVTVRENNKKVRVKIGSKIKPKLTKEITDKWQSLIDTTAQLAKVPSGLIMQLNEKTIDVFIKSNTKENPYMAGEKTELVYGIYCESTIGTQKKMLVPNALKDDLWKHHNPGLNFNMISYLGYPINWPDGEVFGTVCLLDKKENHYNEYYENLLAHIKDHIEDDLKLLVLNTNLEEKNLELQQLNNTKTRFLSLISHDIRGSISTINEFIKLIINDFDQFSIEELKDILTSLSKDASSAYEALESLLSWSKKDFAQIQPEFKPVNVTSIIDSILQYFKQSIHLKGLNVTTVYCCTEGFIDTDENMITVILRNLISNAIKYSKKEGKIAVEMVFKDNQHAITVRDTGIGMSQRTLDRLFVYNKAHKKGTQGESSAGIGLMLTKEFIDKIGAEITVESELEKGSSFRVIL